MRAARVFRFLALAVFLLAASVAGEGLNGGLVGVWGAAGLPIHIELARVADHQGGIHGF